MIYLIVGRTASGKDHIVKLLKKKGLSYVKSYATREPRTPDEDTHIFISKEESPAYEKDKVAKTVIGDTEYFATRQQVENADVYVIDPKAIDILVNNMPDQVFHLIYIMADPMQRKIHAIQRETNKILAEQKFDERNIAEDEQFYQFEKLISSKQDVKLPKNIMATYAYNNQYDENETEKFAEQLVQGIKTNRRMTEIMKECLEMGILRRDEKNPDNALLLYNSKNDTTKAVAEQSVTAEQTANILMGDPGGFRQIMMEYITRSSLFETFDHKQEVSQDES